MFNANEIQAYLLRGQYTPNFKIIACQWMNIPWSADQQLKLSIVNKCRIAMLSQIQYFDLLKFILVIHYAQSLPRLDFEYGSN